MPRKIVVKPELTTEEKMEAYDMIVRYLTMCDTYQERGYRTSFGAAGHYRRERVLAGVQLTIEADVEAVNRILTLLGAT